MDEYINLEDLEKHRRKEKIKSAYGSARDIAGKVGSGIMSFGKGVINTGKATGKGLQSAGKGFQKFQSSMQKSEWGKNLKKQHLESNSSFKFGLNPKSKGTQPFFGMPPKPKNSKKPRGIPNMWDF